MNSPFVFNIRRLLPLACILSAFLCQSSAETGFQRLAADETGIHFEGAAPRLAFTSTQYIDNAGLAAGDVDGDGRCDLFFCGGDGPSQLYRNIGGFEFENITQSSGIDALSQHKINASVLADGDGDGDLDLFLGSLYAQSVYLENDGKGRFSISHKVAWQESPIGGVTSLSLADIDRDGDLDLYTTRYLNQIVSDRMTPQEFDALFNEEIEKIKKDLPVSDEFALRFNIVEKTIDGKLAKAVDENGLNDVLYINDGYGNFIPASDNATRFLDESGAPIPLPQDWGLTASFRDADGDGDADLYVCNDFESPDRFWINDGRGYFSPASKLSLRRSSSSSMGVDFADIDRDGHQDILVVDMLSRSHSLRKKQMGVMMPTQDIIGLIDDRPQIMQNTLFLNRGDGTYAEIAQYAGLKATEWSWAPIFTDIDLDGYQDLIVTTGSIRDFTDADVNAEFLRHKEKFGDFSVEQTLQNQKKLPPLPMKNLVFRNRGDMTFQEIGEEWGISEKAVSSGMALADFDNDGDLDVAINNTSSSPEIYRNQSTARRLSVRLHGESKNSQAIGAYIELQGEGLVQSLEVSSGGIYASGSDSLRVFALPKSSEYSLSVRWPSGKVSRQKVSAKSQTITLLESDALAVEPVAKEPVQALFADVSDTLIHSHTETYYNDFQHQPLLPNRLSQLGPGVSWVDIDRDGDDDLLIPSGRGGHLSIHANTPNGFHRVDSIKAMSDQTTVLATDIGNQATGFLLGVSNHEIQNPGTVMGAMAFSHSKQSGLTPFPNLKESESTTGPMSQADIDGDGDLDLFIGGRAIPEQYPQPADSRIFLNHNGTLIFNAEASGPFEKIGLVSGSVFGDLDQDGDPDLVIACEWGPVRVFTNDNGQFTDITTALGLADLTGWWNGVSLGDLNNDGLLDIVATNWGRNSKYEGSYSADHPLEIFYGDLNGDGTKDVVEAHFDKELQCKVPERGFSCSSNAMPFVRQKMQTFENFGLASLDIIYGEKLEQSDRVTATTLDHTLFINRGNRFEAISLPVAAQLSPAFGVCISDLNGDGNEDVFLAQNFFAVQIETPRNDGGRGLLLLGDGTGQLKALPAEESGIAIYGDQRGTSISDFNNDGRTDIAITQNGADTKLYKNVSAKPGLRVRLKGKGSNASAIGATLRLKFENQWGPTKLISSGSGYWSQESAVPVMGLPSDPQLIEVRWPNGEISRTDLSAHPIDEELILEQPTQS